MNTKHNLVALLVFVLTFCLTISTGHLLTSCSSSSSGDDDDDNDDGISGNVTISGSLNITEASEDISSPAIIKNQISSSGYKVAILDSSTGAQKFLTVDSDGNFSESVTSDTSYIISVLDDDYQYLGTLATGSAEDNTVPIALTTGDAESTTSLGTVSVDTSSGQVTSDESLNANTTHQAYTTDEGIIAGDNDGEGETNYEDSDVTDSIDDTNDPDDDNDGVPDIFDVDNNNNGYTDEVDGDTDKCIPGTVSLYVENYPTTSGIYSPDELSSDLANTTNYQIHLELIPADGTTVDDISEVSVTGPSYLDNCYETTAAGEITNGDGCSNGAWEACNEKKLHKLSDRFAVTLAEKVSGATDPMAGNILNNMFPGDAFVLTITMSDDTTHVCTKTINMIPKYYPYDITLNGVGINTTTTYTNQPNALNFAWSIPDTFIKGMDYSVLFIAYEESGGNCTWDPEDYYEASAGQDTTSLTVTLDEVSANKPSTLNLWQVQFQASDIAGDRSFVGGTLITDSAAAACE